MLGLSSACFVSITAQQFGFNLWSDNVGVSQKNLCQIILGFGSTDSVYLKLQRCIGLASAGDYLINIGLLGFS